MVVPAGVYTMTPATETELLEHFSAPQYTPDGFWWGKIEILCVISGGRADSALKSGTSCFNLSNASGGWNWSIGAFAAIQYTPDDLWWGVGNRYYTLVGDLTNSGLRCGSSSSDLLHPAGYVHSGFGASFYMQYT